MTDLRDLWTRGKLNPSPSAKPEPPPVQGTDTAGPRDSAPKKKAPKKKARKKRKAKAKKLLKSEMLDVICRAAGPHSDLVGLPGFLFIDSADGRPATVQFDPLDETLDNADMDVSGLMRTERYVAVTDAEDGSRWRFEVTRFDSLDEDVLEVDFDAVDYEIDEDHPFNRGWT